MNKIKTLYDVVQTMKTQEKFEGQGKVSLKKDETPVFSMEKTFEKNITEGTMKGKMKTEVHHEGVNMKNESEYDFDKKFCGHGQGHGFHKGFHHGHHHGYHGYHGQVGGRGNQGHKGMGRGKRIMHMYDNACTEGFDSEQMHKGQACGHGFGMGRGLSMGSGFGMKCKLDKISIALDLLNRLEVKEVEGLGKTLKLDLSLKDMPEEMRRHMMKHLMHKHGQGQHFNDFESLEDAQVSIEGQIDAKNKIQMLKVNLKGVYLDKNEEKHTLAVDGEVALS